MKKWWQVGYDYAKNKELDRQEIIDEE